MFTVQELLQMQELRLDMPIKITIIF